MASVRGKRPAIRWGSEHAGDEILGDALEYATVGELDAAWPETDTMGSVSTWEIDTAEVYAEGSTRSMQLSVIGNPGAGADCYRSGNVGGLDPYEPITVRMPVWLNTEALGSEGIAFGFRVNGVETYIEADGVVNRWTLLSATAFADAAGTLAFQWGAFHSLSANYNRVARFDAFTVQRAGGGLLYFGYPADAAIAGPVLRPRSRRFASGAGTEYGQRTQVIDRLQLEARWVPRLDGLTPAGHSVTGWEGASGWEAYLASAWSGTVFWFYPDQEDLVTTYPCTLEQPRPFGGGGEPPFQLEPDGTRRIPLVIRSLSGPFLGY